MLIVGNPVKCKDGTYIVPDEMYEDSELVKDFVDSETTQKWASEHTVDEVTEEVEDLWMK